jgi:integrase/recombinase XerD
MARRTKAPMTRLAVRMKEDLVLSGKRPKTVKAYLAAVRQLARYYNASPEQLSEDQVRKWLVFLTDKKKRPSERCDRSSVV